MERCNDICVSLTTPSYHSRGRPLRAPDSSERRYAPWLSRNGSRAFSYLLLIAILYLSACSTPPAATPPPLPTPTEAVATEAAQPPPAAPLATAAPQEATQTVVDSTPPTTPALDRPQTADRGPFVMDESHCGIRLPVIAGTLPNQDDTPLTPTGTVAADALAQIPDEARPAVEAILAHPRNVALVAYEVGKEGQGFYLNPDRPMPLASVVKVLHLVTYARAVQQGRLDPEMPVSLDDLERYYLPNSDLDAHPRAVAALRDEDRVFGQPPSVRLEDIPRMMIEFSSNAATDYLHQLLGQESVEQTALDLGMKQQTAPCPFLGQFLLMGRGHEGLQQIEELIQEPRLYSRQVMALTEQYSTDLTFRQNLGGWRGRDRRPSLDVQQLFSEALNARGSARDYANLMAQMALNSLGPWEESVRIRRYMEWPTHFPDNQERLAWLGYKGGSLPGILTVVYYAQPWDTVQPVVVALFFHDLPQQTYRQWRRELPHDELARWLLRDREAIPLLRSLLDASAPAISTTAD